MNGVVGGRMESFILVLTVAATTLACGTKPNPAVCHDNQCIDPDAPFCDIDGTVAGKPGHCLSVACTPGEFKTCSGDTSLVCNATGDSYDRFACDAGCEAGAGCRPFCTPGNTLECVGDQMSVCNAAGTGTTSTTCSLGCAAGEKRCYGFDPTNGLGPALVGSSLLPDLVLPPGTQIDTNTGVVRDGNGTAVILSVAFVTQVNSPSIMVIHAASVVANDLTVTGTNALALVAAGSIELRGRLTARAQGRSQGPGASNSPSCKGGDSTQYSCVCDPIPCSIGTGGGGGFGFGGYGGAAVDTFGQRGMPATMFSPLAGGCPGGTQFVPGGAAIAARGGGGGGAVQMVSLTSVTLKDQGLIDVGGGGGESTAGGGSGGLVIIEAPTVTINGTTAGVVANGGAGGGCGQAGPDSNTTGAAAVAPSCTYTFGGNGGTGSLNPTSGCIDSAICMAGCPISYGGGGGSAGRVRIVTRDGAFATNGGPLFSAQVSTSSLTPK